jgi:hypothetical protein
MRYTDGDIREVGYSKDLFDCQPYEDFCKRQAHTYHLIHTTALADMWISEQRNKTITLCVTGDDIYVNIRLFGDIWYYELLLPNSALNIYVTQFNCTH